MFLVAALLWPWLLSLGLWSSHQFHNVIVAIQGCMDKHKWLHEHVNITEAAELREVILSWSFGFLLFNILRVLVFQTMLDEGTTFEVWCAFGFTPFTPTYPTDYKFLPNIFGASITSAMGFMVLLHAVCLPVVAVMRHQERVLNATRMILRKMEGVVEDAQDVKMAYRPITREEWIRTGNDPDVFDAFDVDGNGTLDKDEWVAAAKSRNMFAAMDQDGDGEASRTEWVLKGLDPAAFDMYDEDGDGVVTLAEFESMEAATRRFDKANPDGDGQVSKEEWDAAFEEGESICDQTGIRAGGIKRHWFALYDINDVGYVSKEEFLHSEVARMRHMQVDTDDGGTVSRKEWHAYYGDCEGFDKMDLEGKEHLTIEDWLAAHKTLRRDECGKSKLEKVSQLIVDAKFEIKQLQKEISTGTLTDHKEVLDRMKSPVDQILLQHSQATELIGDKVEERRIFHRQRQMVTKKLRLQVRWKQQMSKVIQMSSSIAIALSYEQIFEGLDDFIGSRVTGTNENCLEERVISLGVRILSLPVSLIFIYVATQLAKLDVNNQQQADEKDAAEPASPRASDKE